MFAVVRTGGKQYRVAEGDKIVVEKLEGDAGDRITLGDVLLAGEGSDLKPTDGLTVAAEIIAQAKGDKVTVFKKKRRHNYRRKRGHRQQHTILQIVAIGKESKKPAKAKADESPAAETKPAQAKAPAQKAAPAADAATAKSAGDDAKKTAGKAEKAKPEKKEAAPKAEKKSTKDAAPAKGGAKKSSKEK